MYGQKNNVMYGQITKLNSKHVVPDCSWPDGVLTIPEVDGCGEWSFGDVLVFGMTSESNRKKNL